MNVIVLLIFASLAVATAFLIAFIWAVRSGQYDDTSTPSLRALIDESPDSNTSNNLPATPDAKNS